MKLNDHKILHIFIVLSFALLALSGCQKSKDKDENKKIIRKYDFSEIINPKAEFFCDNNRFMRKPNSCDFPLSGPLGFKVAMSRVETANQFLLIIRNHGLTHATAWRVASGGGRIPKDMIDDEHLITNLNWAEHFTISYIYQGYKGAMIYEFDGNQISSIRWERVLK